VEDVDMHRRSVVLGAALLAGASVAFGLAARAEDPHGDAPPREADITNPLLRSAVGDWKVTWIVTGPHGEVKGTSTSRFSVSVGGTALVEDYSSPEMVPGGFFGHGVTKVSGDGKTVRTWWFDTMSPEPMLLEGPLTETTSTMEGEGPMGTMRIVWKAAEGGFDFVGTLDGQPWLNQQYRRR
jgi:hypothetical protein